MGIGRRGFLQAAGLGASLLATGRPGHALAADGGNVEFSGMLVDTTRCIGCRSCEQACNEKWGLPKPDVPFDSEEVFETHRDTTPDAFVVVNRFPNPADPKNPVFVRRQCMHCNQPACASACLVKALEKTKEGPVIYNKDRCMGCRYCMIACPFDAPKYQYDSPSPYVRKCLMCFDRLREGKRPACVEACPVEATIFGSRRDLLRIAKARIHDAPGKYVNHVYGEHEVGGTGVLYLSSVPFESLMLRADLGTTPYPEHTAGFLYSVPLVFVLWPALMAGIHHLTGDRKEASHG